MTPVTKEANEAGEVFSTGPLGFLESRTGTTPSGAARRAATYNSTQGHSVCDAIKWAEGIFARFPDQVAFVHPNARGHQNAADHVASAILNAIGVS